MHTSFALQPGARRAAAAGRGAAALAATLLTLTIPARAPADIVNVQPLLGAGGRPGFSGALEASADWRRGNTSLLQVAGTGVARLEHGRNIWFLMARGEYGENSGGAFVNKDMEHLRYRRAVVGPLTVESFAQHERDAFRRLSLRALWGAGPRVHLVRGPVVTLVAGVAYMLEHERLAAGPEPDSGERRLNHRLSSYVVLRVRAAARLFLSQTVYAQPRFDRFADTRVLSDTDLLAVATRFVGVKLTFSLFYDTEPPVNVDALDTALKASLVFTF